MTENERKTLLDDNSALVIKIITTLTRGVIDDDLVQAGREGLVKALNKYDKTKKVKFSTFAYKKIKGAVIDHIIKRSSDSILFNAIPFDDLDITDPVNGMLGIIEFEDILERRELIGKIRKSIERLTYREKEIVIFHYFGEFSFFEIGRQLKLSEMRVSDIHKKILSKLKKELC